MIIDKKAIEEQFHKFWNAHKDQVQFKYAGKTIKADKVSLRSPQFEDRSDNDDYKIHCTALEMRVQSNGLEKPYKGEFNLIIGVSCVNSRPHEYIEEIQDNTIYLRD